MKNIQTEETIKMHEITHFAEKQTKLPNELIEYLDMLEDKYCDLVWYARKPIEGVGKIWEENDWFKDLDKETIDSIRKSVKKISEQYPKETHFLSADGMSDWQHGFNSGMLAFTRLLRDISSEDADSRKAGIMCFPFLDS